MLWDTEKHNLWLGRVVFRDKALGDARVKKQIDVFKQAYNMACDSLNQRGVAAYADLLMKYCQICLQNSDTSHFRSLIFPMLLLL